MTLEETAARYVLRALDRLEPASTWALVSEVQDEAERDGALGPGQAAKLDNVFVGRALVDWHRADPPVVESDFGPKDVLPAGGLRDGAERLYTLTGAGQAELDRLERLT